MQIDKDHYRRLSIADPAGYNDADWVNIQRSPASKAWRIVCVHHLTGEENTRNHHCYVDLLDESGGFLLNPQEKLAYSWNGQRDDEKSPPVKLDKPVNEPVGNVPIWKGAAFETWIDSPYPSDKATNLTTARPDESEGNTEGHHSYYIIWQLQDNATQEVDPTPPVDYVDNSGKIYVEVNGVIDMLEALRTTMEAYLLGLGREYDASVLNGYFDEAKNRFKKGNS